MSYWGYPEYVSVAEKQRRALKQAQRLEKNGRKLTPVKPEGRKAATTFWGAAWCRHIETLSDYESRLPRGRSYLSNGLVVDLQIDKGVVNALVSGSDLYEVQIEIKSIAQGHWDDVKARCTGQIDSVVDLLKGTFGKPVMEHVTNAEKGMFPKAKEISYDCTCPDGALLCKHLAAVFYGIGTRLDTDPAMLFKLRGVDPDELVCQAVMPSVGADAVDGEKGIATDDLAAIFGVEMAEVEDVVEVKTEIVAVKKAKKPAVKKKVVEKKGKVEVVKVKIPAPRRKKTRVAAE